MYVEQEYIIIVLAFITYRLTKMLGKSRINWYSLNSQLLNYFFLNTLQVNIDFHRPIHNLPGLVMFCVKYEHEIWTIRYP